MMIRMASIITTTLVTSTVSVIGAVVGIQGGDFWPWVWVMVVMWGIELVYTSIIAIRYYQSPEAQRKRAFYKKRQAQKAIRLPS